MHRLFSRTLRHVVVHLLALLALASTPAVVLADTVRDADQAILRKDYASARRLLEPLARAGDARAQLRLGEMAYHGHGQPEDDRAALAWYEQAARQGLAEAQLRLGHMYAYGHVGLDPRVDTGRLAAQWYFEAARQGLAEAQYSLGVLFLTGTGVQHDDAQAMQWMRRAAAQGHADARVYLEHQGLR